MAAEIALVTANMGGIDPCFAPPSLPDGLDAFYYADRTCGQNPRTWTRVLIDEATQEPRLRSKFFKCQIHRLPEVQGCRWLAWADASIEFHSLNFLIDWAHIAGETGERAVFVPHPHRQTVAEEYAYVLQKLAEGNEYLSSRYSADGLEREREHFGRSHDLSKLRLWAGGLWLLPNMPRAHAFLDAWWDCVLHYTIIDQPAISPLLAEHGIEPIAFDVPLYDNQYWTRRAHP